MDAVFARQAKAPYAHVVQGVWMVGGGGKKWANNCGRCHFQITTKTCGRRGKSSGKAFSARDLRLGGSFVVVVEEQSQRHS